MYLLTRISMYQRKGGGFKCKIEHNGRVVVGEHPYNAIRAYGNAEINLVIKPGFVQSSDPADGEP